jgi:hypothetical protein
MNPEDKKIIELLENTAQAIKPNIVFEHELEKRLTAAHKPKRDLLASLRQNIFPTLGWTVALVVLAFALNWTTRSLLFGTPAAGDGFICPVTEPNGSLPPNETVPSSEYLGNSQLWTSLWPDGKVMMEPYNHEADGSFSMKWGWVRAVTGPLTIEGHRLDADAEPLHADIPDGYGDTGFQVSALIFPTTGCWEVTGRVGDASLTFVTEVVFGEPTPTPKAQINGIPTIQADAVIAPQGEAYDWNGSTIYLNTSLPESVPSEMKIYLARNEVRASVEDVRTLADRFQMNGEIYKTAGELPDTTDYLMIDGNRQLHVRSDRYYIYYPNYAEYAAVINTSSNPNAESLVNEFLQTYGVNEQYQMDLTDPYSVTLLPYTPDGFVIREGSYLDIGMTFRFNQNGIVSVDSSLLKYDEIKSAGIISAQEAFDRLLAPVPQYESLMNVTPKTVPTKSWVRSRPLDETITYYGWLTSTGKSVSGGNPYIALSSYPVSGNVQGIAENLQNTFVEAVGQFHEKNGVRSFEIETWKKHDGYEEGYVGTVQLEGDKTVIATNDGLTFTIPDVPADLLVPAENIFITGVARGDILEWQNMYDGPAGGGGGGGGGLGFFKLNLSGTPLALPTLAPTPTPEPMDTTPIEGLRGIVTVNIYEKEGGTRRMEYTFIVNSADHLATTYYSLAGDALQGLEKYNNRPVDLWGTPAQNPDGQFAIHVDRYEIPYPDLHFLLTTGTQKLVTLEGEPATLFTTEDGTQYAQLFPDGSTGSSLMGAETDKVILEVLAIPAETFGGYPAIRIFGGSLAVDPASGQPYKYIMTASEPNVMPERVQQSDYTPTIEKVELVYYTPDQRYAGTEPAAEPLYLQPVWRFYGHYSNGDEFEYLMQALKDEYLLPTHINEP